MVNRKLASLAAGCVRTARGLMDCGFLQAAPAGGFAFTFENGDPDVLVYMVPASTPSPQVMLLRGESAFLGFQAVMLPSEETVYTLDLPGVGA